MKLHCPTVLGILLCTKTYHISFENIHDLGNSGELIKTEFKSNRLRSSLSETELTKAIKELYRASRTALEENGANTLYLVLGILRWFETSKSTKARYKDNSGYITYVYKNL